MKLAWDRAFNSFKLIGICFDWEIVAAIIYLHIPISHCFSQFFSLWNHISLLNSFRAVTVKPQITLSLLCALFLQRLFSFAGCWKRNLFWCHNSNSGKHYISGFVMYSYIHICTNIIKYVKTYVLNFFHISSIMLFHSTHGFYIAKIIFFLFFVLY